MLCRGDCSSLQGDEVDHDVSGVGAKTALVFINERGRKRRGAYSNPRLWVAQRCTEFAVSGSTTNATSVCPTEGLPTCIAQMPGTFATYGFVPADDAARGRVFAGRPVVAGDVTLFEDCQLRSVGQ